MAYLDHDLGPEGATRVPDRPIQRTTAQPPVLDLQRLAGNAAVSQAIKSGTFAPNIPIQREDDPEAMEAEEEEVQEEEEVEAGGEELAAAEEEMSEEEKEE
jgi:hypothetical protein